MRALLDTHIFIHMLGDPDRLSPGQRAVIDDTDCDLYLSLASVWEITIKYTLGKLRLPAPPEAIFPSQLQELGVELVSISLDHVLQVGTLPHHHGDPFDRLIIAQAQLENLPVISSDRHFPVYGIQVIV